MEADNNDSEVHLDHLLDGPELQQGHLVEIVTDALVVSSTKFNTGKKDLSSTKAISICMMEDKKKMMRRKEKLVAVMCHSGVTD